MADVAELLVTARRALARGDHHKALPLLRQAAQVEPDLFGTQMLLGVCLTACGNSKEGIEALRRAVRLNPDSAHGHYNLGAALRDAGRRREAEKHFSTALRIDAGYSAASSALKALRAQPPSQEKGWPAAPSDGSSSAQRAGASSAPATQAPPPLDRPRRRPRRARIRRQVLRARPLAHLPLGRWLFLVAAGALFAAGAIGLPSRGARAGHLIWVQSGDFSAIRFSPDSRTLVGADAGLTIWDAAGGRLLASWARDSEDILDLDLSPDGTVAACSAQSDSAGISVTLRRVSDGTILAELPATCGRKPLAISPDGTRLAVGTDYMGTARPLGIQLWSIPEGEFVRSIGQSAAEQGIGYVAALAFSADGSLLAAADDAGVIRIYQTWDGTRIKTISTEGLLLTALAFTPQGALAYAGTSGPHVVVCTVPAGDRVALLQGEDHAAGRFGLPPAVTDLDIFSDGRFLVMSETTRDLARIEVFDLDGGGLLATVDALAGLRAHTADGVSADVRSVQFSPDGRYLAWCGSSGVAVASLASILNSR
jgi:hypothetical protein